MMMKTMRMTRIILKKKDWMCDLRLLQLSAAATMRGRRNAAVTITMKFVRGKRNYVPHT